jgi:hypothetical protein
MGAADLDAPHPHDELEALRRRYAAHVLAALRRRAALNTAPGVGKPATPAFPLPVPSRIAP